MERSVRAYFPDIDALLPHRGSMKLIETILTADDQGAVTAAMVAEHWPLREDDGISPLVLVELAAQTAAVGLGWKRRRDGQLDSGSGWLVGIREADFFLTRLPFGATVITRSRNDFTLDNYTEVACTATVGERSAAAIRLQVLRAAAGALPGKESHP
jgi:predicted hotdog family 3-hydroxylacyl-ACP dehydratase